jgi:hypothetical protein
MAETSNMDLHIHGHYDLNSYLNLSVTGATIVTDTATLYVDSVGEYASGKLLYIEGHKNELNSYITLHIPGGTAGMFSANGAMTLYMTPPKAERAVSLFVKNTEPYAPYAANKTLYIEGYAAQANASMDLYMQLNEDTSGSMTLYVKTPGMWAGYVPAGDSITLFINRPDESIAMNLFLKAPDNLVNSYAPLHITSYVENTGTMTLCVPNVASEPLNTYASLIVAGTLEATDSETLFVDAHGVLNAVATLVAWQETGYPNTYANLYVAGAYLDNASMTLAMPTVVDDTPYGSIPLYVFGW